jgi:hypothetical protein
MIHFLSISAGVAEKVFMEGIPVNVVKGPETRTPLSDGWVINTGQVASSTTFPN